MRSVLRIPKQFGGRLLDSRYYTRTRQSGDLLIDISYVLQYIISETQHLGDKLRRAYTISARFEFAEKVGGPQRRGRVKIRAFIYGIIILGQDTRGPT